MQKAQRSARDYTVREALGTWQWYALWALLLLNVTAGIAIISQAAAMAEEITGVAPSSPPAWSASSPSPTGRFGTMPAFVADYFGPKNVGSVYGLMLIAWGVAGAAAVPHHLTRARDPGTGSRAPACRW